MLKKIISIIIIAGLFLIVNIPTTIAENENDMIDQEQTGTINDFAISNGASFAQSFIPSLDTMTRAKICIKPKDYCQDYGYIKLSIRTDLMGNDLTSKTLTAADLPDIYYWVEFDFKDTSITPGKTHYLVIEVDKNGYETGFCFKTGSALDAYPYGSMFMRSHDHETWFDWNHGQDLSFQIYGKNGNPLPYQPNDPSPNNNGNDVRIDTQLTWSGGDPEGETVYYDVYFEQGDSTPDVLVSNDQEVTYFKPTGNLELETTYYWQVVARDENGGESISPVWKFTTESEPQVSDVEIINKGGFNLKTQITNKGTQTISNVHYEITIQGGIFKRINSSINDTIDSIETEGTESVTGPKTGLFNLGSVVITTVVTTSGKTYTKESNGFVLFGFLFVSNSDE